MKSAVARFPQVSLALWYPIFQDAQPKQALANAMLSELRALKLPNASTVELLDSKSDDRSPGLRGSGLLLVNPPTDSLLPELEKEALPWLASNLFAKGRGVGRVTRCEA